MKRNIIWLSLGENCLPDDVLSRHGRKSFSTPFSSGRTNIDYALELEAKNYDGLLIKSNLQYFDAWSTKVVRSTLINQSEDIYDASCMKGFEFTHHDPIASQKDLESLTRKVERMLSLKGNESVVFLYHHRKNPRSDLKKLLRKLVKFNEFYSNEFCKSYIVLFYQTLCMDEAHRRIILGYSDKSILEFNFHTKFFWQGADPLVFWAKSDDDLFSEMFLVVDKNFGF